MPIRTILTPFVDASDTPALRSALAAATHLEAHVIGLYAEAPERSMPSAGRVPAMAGPGGGSFGMSGIRAELSHLPDPVTEATRQRDQAAESARAGFRMLCEKFGVPVQADGSVDAEGYALPSASFRREIGSLPRLVGQLGHACDLIVMESAAIAPKDAKVRAAIKTALLHAGRPVLLAPTHTPDRLDGRVLVAWNDTPQSWHALSVALPFLTLAAEVMLFHAGKDPVERQAEARAADYLGWHGVKAETLQREPAGRDVADYLLSQCNELQVGLMVMGAYSHSPLRESLFGGVTREIVANVAATPVLMVH